jgi:PASTA domain
MACLLAACSSSAKAHGPVLVPDVVGMRVCDALPTLVKAGVVPEGTPSSEITWIVASQSPRAGERHVRGDAERLALRPDPTPESPPMSDYCKQAIATNALP